MPITDNTKKKTAIKSIQLAKSPLKLMDFKNKKNTATMAKDWNISLYLTANIMAAANMSINANINTSIIQHQNNLL